MLRLLLHGYEASAKGGSNTNTRMVVVYCRLQKQEDYRRIAVWICRKREKTAGLRTAVTVCKITVPGAMLRRTTFDTFNQPFLSL